MTLEESTLSLVRKLKKLWVHGFQITDPNNYDFFFGGKNPREVCYGTPIPFYIEIFSSYYFIILKEVRGSILAVVSRILIIFFIVWEESYSLCFDIFLSNITPQNTDQNDHQLPVFDAS